MSQEGCSAQPEGVDDDGLGVELNYICAAVLLVVALVLRARHGYATARRAILYEIGMSIGYLFGGVVHGTFPNRASDDACAAYWFYPLFTCDSNTICYC